LIDSRTGGHVWANRFDRDLTDIFVVQDELTKEIVTALKLKLTVVEQDRLAGRRTVDVEAYQFLLRGREQALTLSRGGNIAARGLADANDLENLPFFLVAGFLFLLTDPSLLLARVLLYGYVVSRLLHFAAYFTAQTHDTRATLWTVGSLILIFMTCRTLLAALGY
jgi:uncharacterized MAPEG superfamily protein